MPGEKSHKEMAATNKSRIAIMEAGCDGVNMAKQISILMMDSVHSMVFSDSRSLLETIRSSNQVAEKSSRQSVGLLKQSLEDGDVEPFAGIEGKDIVADVL